MKGFITSWCENNYIRFGLLKDKHFPCDTQFNHKMKNPSLSYHYYLVFASLEPTDEHKNTFLLIFVRFIPN